MVMVFIPADSLLVIVFFSFHLVIWDLVTLA